MALEVEAFEQSDTVAIEQIEALQEKLDELEVKARSEEQKEKIKGLGVRIVVLRIINTNAFCIKVNIDKSDVVVNEVIEISVVFRNLIAQDITIEVIDHIANANHTQLLQGNLGALIEVALMPYGEFLEHHPVLFEGFTVILPANAVIEKTIKDSAREAGDHWIIASTTFFVGENRQERISVAITPIMVNVTKS